MIVCHCSYLMPYEFCRVKELRHSNKPPPAGPSEVPTEDAPSEDALKEDALSEEASGAHNSSTDLLFLNKVV